MKLIARRVLQTSFLLLITFTAGFSQNKKSEKKAATDFSALKITELNYHPRDVVFGNDTVNGKSYEFIEFKNTGAVSLNLSGLRIDSAIKYTFPANSILESGEFYVVATKPSDFYTAYGRTPSGNCEGFFNNSGDTLIVYDTADNVLITFIYSDDTPWPQTPDGDGYTLTSAERNPTGNPSDYNYWSASTTLGGSPFSDDYQYSSIRNYLNTNQNQLGVYPNPALSTVSIELLKPTEFTVFDVSGIELMHFTANPAESIDVSQLEPGIYFIIDNKTRLTGRFCKE
jgi:hypothetical protein